MILTLGWSTLKPHIALITHTHVHPLPHTHSVKQTSLLYLTSFPSPPAQSFGFAHLNIAITKAQSYINIMSLLGPCNSGNQSRYPTQSSIKLGRERAIRIFEQRSFLQKYM